jgi:urease accessory protein
MLHVHTLAPKGAFRESDVAGTVVLDHEERRRRRGVMSTIQGLSFHVDLPAPPMIRAGDGYRLEDGRVVEVVAAPEPLLEVRAREPLHMTRIAYHLGNRHLECEIGPRWLRIRRDHVIAEMLTGLGAKVTEIEAPFHPEGGAYEMAAAHGHGHHDHIHHGHDHGHHHDHGHDHGHNHAHDHGHNHAHDHHHGAHHTHDHAHGRKHEH